ncbi:tryptase gamma-like isoform X2 [Notolabrus celidotus]|uniref:tryptase gamma-like isoform X2 n=1 Tax=Notolabrus celidotus TaxID=1203425 RepID=UPI00148FB9A6|nr:tryptase gamma-like isoform X2 [Notolabrus celidotus]
MVRPASCKNVFFVFIHVLVVAGFTGCDSDMSECGRVIEGHDYQDYWPWHAVITHDGGRQCSGSLISSDLVLTNSDCGFDAEFTTTVSLGRRNTSDFVEFWTVQSRLCYDSTGVESGFENALACVLTLSVPVNFTDSIYPVCLAAPDSTLRTGMESWVPSGSPSGGNVEVQVVGNNECRSSIPGLTEHEICAGPIQSMGSDELLDECQDGSGGALVTRMNSTWIQIGIASSSQSCPRHKTHNLYNPVSRVTLFAHNYVGQGKHEWL